MQRRTVSGCLLLALAAGPFAGAQATTPLKAAAAAASNTAAPLPTPAVLLADVERNEKRMEALQRDYTYHVHTEEQQLDKNGAVKKTETEDAESLTIDGIRVDRVTARNGKPLTPEEQGKENDRIDKVVAKAKQREADAAAKGQATDDQGHPVLTLSRILELGSFSDPQRVTLDGRPTITMRYTGNPAAKTHSSFEGVFRDLTGTVWIDEADRILVRGQGQFQKDFKIGGGLVADVRKGTSFDFRATRVADGIWLPAAIEGQGSLRVLLFVHLNGRMHLTTSDYKRFRASATIVGSHGAIDADGNPMPGSASQGAPKEPPPAPASLPPNGNDKGRH